MKTKENVEWASPRFSQRLLCLKRSRPNEVLQVLTGHCNLQKYRNTSARVVSTTCPKCNLEEETQSHHMGDCVFYQKLQRKIFGKETNAINCVVDKLATYLQQTGRLAEYDQSVKAESGETGNGIKLWPTQRATGD